MRRIGLAGEKHYSSDADVVGRYSLNGIAITSMLRAVTFGQLMKLLRGSRSQKKIADDAGLAQTYISQLERDDHSPTLDAARKIARALGCDLEWLVHIWETTEGLAEGTSFDMAPEEFAAIQAELMKAMDERGRAFSRTFVNNDDELLQLAAGLDFEARLHLIGLLKKLAPKTAEELEAAERLAR